MDVGDRIMTFTVQQLIDRLQRHADDGKADQLVAVLDPDGDASEVRGVDDHEDYLVILADKDPRPSIPLISERHA